MRESVQPIHRIGKTGLGEGRQCPRAQFRRRQGRVQLNRLRHLFADAVQRVEAGHWFLEHDAGDTAARPVQRIGAAADDALPIQQDFSCRIAAAGR